MNVLCQIYGNTFELSPYMYVIYQNIILSEKKFGSMLRLTNTFFLITLNYLLFKELRINWV